MGQASPLTIVRAKKFYYIIRVKTKNPQALTCGFFVNAISLTEKHPLTWEFSTVPKLYLIQPFSIFIPTC
tara:strand:- start:84122 stop:84331 length:210 start_codon:yes stop_codon:yes gene_type:complete